MSNQTPRKPAGSSARAGRSGPAAAAPKGSASAKGSRPAPSNAGSRPASSGSSGKVVVSPAKAARPTGRISQPIGQKKQRGFRLRPVDMGLIALGVVAVVALVWAVLSSTSTNGVAADDPRARLASRTAIPLVTGQQAPDFSLPATDGTTYTLSQFKGKVVLLELFAPWCPHCQADSTVMNSVYNTYQGKNVQLLAVSASPFGQNYENGDDSLITMADVQWFKTTFNVPFPMLFDKDVKVSDEYGVVSFPTIYVINPQGGITAEPDNPVSEANIDDAINAALVASGMTPADTPTPGGSQ